MPFLIASLIALALGPLLYRATQGSHALVSAIDSFVFVGIGGLVIVHILPESVEQKGWPALAVAALGLFGPLVFEHFLHRAAKGAHLVALVLAFFGLALHACADGIVLSETRALSLFALSNPSTTAHHLLPLAVVLHRLPEGLTVWWLLRPIYGIPRALVALFAITLATVVGFLLGPSLPLETNHNPLGLFQALMAGALLHVVIHRPHPMVHACEKKSWHTSATLGALASLGLLFLLGNEHAFGSVTRASSQLWTTLFTLALESAPALVIAYFIAGIVHAFLPGASLAWLKRGGGLSQSFRGLVFGMPLPICSCGVLPVYRSLVLQGTPAPAAIAFLVATPELGFDSVFLSVPFLGVTFTIIRLICAALVAVLVGWRIGRWIHPPTPLPAAPNLKNQSLAKTARIKEGLKIGLGEMVDHTGPWIVVGLVIAALVSSSIGSVSDVSWLHALPAALEVPLFALLGIPAYVCASGATPLAAVLIGKGVSPGAALAFLLTGPATNATTFGILSNLHGKKVALGFGASIGLLSIGLGTMINIFFHTLEIPSLPSAHEINPPIANLVALIFLGVIFFVSLLRQGPRHFVGQVLPSAAHGDE